MVDNGARYRVAWRSAVVVLTTVGVLAAFLFVGLSSIVVAFLMGGIMVGSVQLSVGLAQERQAPELVRSVVRWAVRAGFVVVAICGYATATGTATLALLLLIGATSPPAIRWLYPNLADPAAAPAEPRPVETIVVEAEPPKQKRRRRKRVEPEPASPEPEVSPPPAPVVLTELSEEELCLAWRRSFTELEHCTTDAQRLEVAARRTAVLDELERRDPKAFAEWLDSGPRAAGDPSKFFTPRTNHGEPD
ncbi:hypothetical protein EV646_11788 [Kribbella antiqua]|uniref:Uncharacterized protein n=1 Tax=Kribbella antiqua TaxID=2512217 RepID=A0A4R2I8T4_9ACTN|nr:hypothetical protein [Kribbella antiqua]TCO40547.1 hypothetical protein EV646_11788 [Kribbella antiqua]